ncbi:helix-turn-helix transcriptional regulator [Maricaulis sp.]|uniref:helix-turn-helix transcriptional regulator n=1 Tax=Maricaulis sp. TaxID=1486257 RepID=UPI002B274839|nr:helix-turn-helix transcriptional regulator [Maricaulis sp.]
MISEALRLLRVFHDLKQYELSEKLGISKSHVSEIENGNRTPSLDVIQRYAEVFRVPVSSIMFFAESIESPSSTVSKSDPGKSAISDKILGFLRWLETRTEVEDLA